jgi:ABC-2 type transport system permease protein
MNFLEQYHALMTIIRKEITRCVRIKFQVFLPPVISMALFYCIFGSILGRHIPTSYTSGVAYIQYISPGLIMMSILMNSFINTSSSFFGSKFSRSIEEMIVSPMPNYIILLGYICGGVFRGIVVGILVVLMSLFFTHLQVQHWVVLLAVAFLTSVFFSQIGLLNGIFAKNFDDISWIPSFVIQPLTYLAGVFYSIQQLPPFWKLLSLLDPIHYIINNFRYAMLGVEGQTLTVSLLVLVGLNIVFFMFNLYLMKYSKGMRQ